MRAPRARMAGIAVVVALASVQLGSVVVHAVRGEDGAAGAGLAAVPALLGRTRAPVRSVAAYEGLGAWVDLYDLAAPGAARVTPRAVDAMAAAGVRTLYLQAAREDGTGTPAVARPGLLAQFLVRAHERGLRVVAWYVPRFGDVRRDLAHLRRIARFEVLGHRFDGVAVDIEWTGTVVADDTRSDRVVRLSRGLHAAVGDLAVGAIVLPPVQLEVVNPGLWPDFPWRRLAPYYDVWLPMGYWTARTPASGYRDAGRYITENLNRLRADLGTDAPVHVIGGVGAGTTVADVDGFAAALARARRQGRAVIGASLYDWATVTAAARERLGQRLAASGALAPPS